MTVDSVQPAYSGSSTSQTAVSSAATEGASTTLSSDFNTFLQMLTVQMQNQDPLNPVDSSDYATQLATFSSVEQQVLSNDLLQSLVGQMSVMGMAQLSGWVGMEARAPAAAYFDGSPITIAPNPVAIADEVTLIVRDADGIEVQREPLAISADPIEWAGVDVDGNPLPNGLYTFEVESSANGEVVLTEVAEIYSRIVEARGENGGTVLVLEGGATVNAGGITAIREPS